MNSVVRLGRATALVALLVVACMAPQAVASDSGAELVSLSTSQLPEGGTYQDLIRDIANTVADALAPQAR